MQILRKIILKGEQCFGHVNPHSDFTLLADLDLILHVSEASDQRVLCERNSPYQQISVVQTGNLRYLRFKNSNQSAL